MTKNKKKLAEIRKLRPKMGRQKLKGALFLLTRLIDKAYLLAKYTTHTIDYGP